ncbi:MAG: hypothetical protein K1X88_06200 [Nannocystaceae bacterium]|nr:hypothetical protein [Nannocystaceae bacterium]
MTRTAWLLLGYLALAIAVLRPDARPPGATVVAGAEPCDTVPFALAWAIDWGLSRIDAGLVGYWDAPIFHPIHGSFALSEPMPLLSAAVWPLHSLGVPLHGCVLALVLAMLTLDGLFVQRWLRVLGAGPRWSTVGGAIATMLPFLHQELGVLPLLALWPAVWTMTALAQLEGPRPLRAAIALGGSIAIGFGCCAQLTLLTVLVATPVALVRLRPRRVPWRAIAIAVAIGSGGVAPQAWVQHRTLASLGLRRSETSQDRGAATPGQLLRLPWAPLEPLPRSMIAGRTGARAFDPGPVRLALAAIAATVGLRARRRRRTTAALLVMLATAVGLALAPRISVAGFEPYDVLTRVVPGLDRVRAVFRVLALAQLAAIALAMLGLRALEIRIRALRRRGRARRWHVPALVLLAGLALVELVPPTPRWTALPPSDARWIAWLREHTAATDAVAVLPLPEGSDACDYEGAAIAMLQARAHGRPLFNGYSSYFPPQYTRIARAVRMLPDGRATLALRTLDVRWVVATDAIADGLDQATRDRLGLHAQLHDRDAGITVFALRAPARAGP